MFIVELVRPDGSRELLRAWRSLEGYTYYLSSIVEKLETSFEKGSKIEIRFEEPKIAPVEEQETPKLKDLSKLVIAPAPKCHICGTETRWVINNVPTCRKCLDERLH